MVENCVEFRSINGAVWRSINTPHSRSLLPDVLRVDFDLFVFVLMGFLGHPEKFAGSLLEEPYVRMLQTLSQSQQVYRQSNVSRLKGIVDSEESD
ncbi:hypothetical protein TNCV_1995811 [Trichonephila clavipes]|nr:hypothetical protein TNCV_1995811 [Trichonephila clavipes]